MPIKSFFAWLVFVTIALFACSEKEDKPWGKLPRSLDEEYGVFVRYFKDDAQILPFHLAVSANPKSNSPTTILRTAQCEDVTVFHTSESLVIFYDHLDVTGFIGGRTNRGIPNALLCDNIYPECKQRRASLENLGAKGQEICRMD